MRVLQVPATGRAEVAERLVPEAGPGEVLVDVLACGLCGTDRHILRGEYPSRLPLVLGHEFGGRIRSSATDSAWRPGDIVSVDPNISCGHCTDCRAGRVALCPSRYALGVDVDGGLSEVAVVPEAQLHRIPEVNPYHLAFVEPLACCLRGMDLAHLAGGEQVAVVGGGVMGQLVVQLAALAGASRVTLITRQAARRRVAEQLAATDSFAPADADVSLARCFDVVVECAGVIETFSQSLRLARRGGSVILLGIPPEGATVPVSPFSLVVDELRIQGSFLNPLTQERAAQMVGSGVLQLDPLISQVLTLDEVPGALSAPPGDGHIKYVVEPGRT
jgi:2-desacetyl-2-hydroxyethyl bacteriochlorophyllide A dehydrogenase